MAESSTNLTASVVELGTSGLMLEIAFSVSEFWMLFGVVNTIVVEDKLLVIGNAVVAGVVVLVSTLSSTSGALVEVVGSVTGSGLVDIVADTGSVVLGVVLRNL